jgi:GTP cyclohydrolase II
MRVFRASGSSNLFGTKGQVGVSRALAEFHARRPILISAGNDVLLALPVEGLTAERLEEFSALCAPAIPRLVVTAHRAQALGLAVTAPVALPLTSDHDVAAILALVTDVNLKSAGAALPVGPTSVAAIQLAKLSQGLPAVLAADVAVDHAAGLQPQLIAVEAEAIGQFREDAIQSLTIASEAAVPINHGSQARFVVFRDSIGGSSVAIIVGNPDFTKPVPVRLHSACLTGDVFGSRRCDCGDQLRLALTRLEDIGGGIILYLAQEGRGLGLVNKMRTYQMQDDGLDTVDANTTLGFDDDERDYGVAAQMLKILNCPRVQLLTNNPTKLGGLASAGIEITGRIPLEAPINADNRRYLTAKVARAGHHLEHLMTSLTEPSETKGDVAPLAP